MITRRRVLKIAAGLGVAPIVPVLAGCGDTADAVNAPANLFEHGVASGDPLPNAVILWTRLSTGDGGSAVDVAWEVADDPGFAAVVASGTARADASRDHTVKVDVVGLEPGATYHYRFVALGLASPVGRTRTAPAGGTNNVRFAVVSCSSLAHGYFHSYRRLAPRDDLDAVVHLGDYIYEYGDGEYGDVRALEPSHEIVALDDYRLRYSQYRRDADLQEIHRRHPFITVWDDHESADNSWRGGAVNHQPENEGPWAERRAAAEQAYSEWMPIRDQADGRIFRSFSYGDMVDLIMLDTRLWGRDTQLGSTTDPGTRDPARELIGREQAGWLAEQLRASRARWRILGQQVMMGPLKLVGLPESQGGGQTLNPDQWDGYYAARRRLFELVRAESPGNLVVLTGDIHTSWAIELTDDPNDPASYDPATGAGAVGVEFVTTSVTSPGIDGVGNDLIPVFQSANPHIKWADLERRGYVVLDVTSERVQAAWFHFDRVDLPDAATETFARALVVRAGETLLREDDAPATG